MSDVLASPHPEIIAAVEYLCGHSSTSSFRDALVAALSARFTNRWHPSDPERGSAYRCLTRASAAPSSLDPLLRRAIVSSNGSIADVAAAMARSMNSDRWTLWIDPGCVSIRMHDNGGGQTLGGSNSDNGTGPAKMGALVGIKEIWGTLPAALIAKSHQSASPPMPMTATRRPSTPQSTIKKMRTNSASANTVATESQDLALNASPSKRSRAIAIVRPESKMATAVIPTPARMPPLSFTLEESTSPYVPSFATGTSAKTASVGGSSSSRCVTPTPPLPLPVSSPLSCDGAANSDDPFARPSSRSSTASNGSNASCSIFSHSSSESRSSSIGSYSTLASSTVPFSSAASAKDFVPRATPLEMNMAASFQFPANASGLSVLGANTAKSAPNSPSKARRAPRHQHQGHGHTLSTSSAVSVASSAGSSTAAGSQHTRGRASQSSQSSIRVNNSSSTVQDYSNGKVGVLGGGVLLGLAGGSGAAKKDAGAAGQARKHRATSSASSNVSSNGGEADMTVTMSRPRSRSRTPSAHGHANAGQVPMWYNQHQYQPMPVLSHQSHSWN